MVAWSRVTIELVEPDDPAYGKWDWEAITESGPVADPDFEPADLWPRKALARRIAELLADHPDALTEGRQFRVRVHRPNAASEHVAHVAYGIPVPPGLFRPRQGEPPGGAYAP